MWQTTFNILGSLGVFIFGMKLMSEGLQRVSGERLRNVMRSMTKNRTYGILTGSLVTVSVQSSTATTVMLVGFVNARVLSLREALGVIMGANLGTTATFWLIAIVGFKFNLSQVALPVIGLGTAFLFFRSARWREYGQFMVGFGLIFLGLAFLRESVPDVTADAETYMALGRIADWGFLSVFLFFLFGIGLTIAVQSSSAAGAISIALAYNGWIGYEHSAAIILGENIGTTITAILASLAGDRRAKQAALGHVIFNVIGVVWALLLFYPFLSLVEWLYYADVRNPHHLPGFLALFHTLFNALNILLLVGFIPQLERLVQWMIPVSGKPPILTDKNRLAYISSQLTQIGELNLIEGQKEVARLAQTAERMLVGFLEVFNSPDQDLSEKVKALKKMEVLSDELARDITDYFIQCTAHELSERSASTVSALLRVVAELEDISDCCYRLVLLARKRYRKHLDISEETKTDLQRFSGLVLQFLQFTRDCLQRSAGPASLETGFQLGGQIDSTRKKLRKAAIKRMEAGGNVRTELITIDVLGQFEKVGNHSLNILQVLQRAPAGTRIF